ncbi:MAG: hypothetical protein C0190_00045 [Thermodesulfobacterium geofontis]|uniref:YjgP/YjgQ family permease n=1 Tax=Thermodesulfobacterium geofontis TaxID=1295609 RepID=A0A2N7QGK8_9BACT|nr:MAG: hypothetical protein C0190_00045 [Thermodesulfobacterium geofontis]PMP98097.1 MAG: hypothetical protein C0169_00645 [Thermodesulfobacterium geofontis]
MRIYKKYLLADLIKVNLLLLFIFSVFYFLVDFFEKLGSFLSFKKPFYLFLAYVFWKSLANFYEFFPFVCGLSGILLLFWLTRTGELLAFFSLGFSKKEIISLIGKGIFFFALMGGLAISIIFPKAAFLSLYTWDYKIAEKREYYLIFNEQIFLRGSDFYLIAKPLEPKGEYLQDILVVFVNKEEPKKVIWAKEGYYKSKKWILKEVIIQEDTKNFSPEFFENLEADLPLKPETLVVVEKPLKFLSMKELFERYKFLKMVNRPYEEVLAEIFLKVIYIFIPLFLGLFPMVIFVKNYAPSQVIEPFLKSLIWYFILLIFYLFLQALIRKGIFVASILLFLSIVISFFSFLLILFKK